MKNTLDFITSDLPGSMTYEAYMQLMHELVEAGKTTGANQSEAFVKYTFLNRHRMNRLNKTVELTSSLKEALDQYDQQVTWLVISEAWCGDAAQNMPVMQAMALYNPNITLRVILRDEHLEIMDEWLTNGGRSIPKLIAFDEQQALQFSWGPRPAPVQDLVAAYKAMPEPKKPYSEFTEEVQKWYAKDKTLTMQSEFEQVLLHIKGNKKETIS